MQIWHRPDGEIVAWGHLLDDLPVMLEARPLADPELTVIEAHVDTNLLEVLHESYCVDVASGSIRVRTDTGA